MLNTIRTVVTSNNAKQQLKKVREEVQELIEAEHKSRKNEPATRVKAAEEAVDLIVATMTYLDILIKEINTDGVELCLNDVIDLVNHKNKVRGRF